MMSSIVFDQASGIAHPMEDAFTLGLLAKRDSLIELAWQVRQREIELLPEGHTRWVGLPCPHPFIYGAFSWFATSLTAYLQLLPLADRLRQNPATITSIIADRESVKAGGAALLNEVCPAVKYWRDKVGAHAAMADPRKDNSLALLLASVTYAITASNGRFHVGVGAHLVFPLGSRTEPESVHTWESWSITETFDRLSSRFWPDASLK
jgi:hypothetical protein